MIVDIMLCIKLDLTSEIRDRGFGALSVGFLTETDSEPSLEQRATAMYPAVPAVL